MTKSASASALRRLSRHMGIETRYRDMSGRPKEASDDALTAVLGAMGLSLAHSGQAEDALESARRDYWERLSEPVVVAWEGRIEGLSVRLPSVGGSRRLDLTLHGEGGGERTASIPFGELPLAALAQAGGTRHEGRTLSWPSKVPFGVHRLSLECGGRTAEVTVLSAPKKAVAPGRGWGVFAPTYALRSVRSGLGDFGDLLALVEQDARWGAGYTGTLPLLPLFLDRRGDPSPYAPVSRLFWHELYIDAADIPELGAVPGAAALVESPGYQAELERLKRAPDVSHRDLYDMKLRLFSQLSAFFYAHRHQRFESAEAFEAPEAVWDYARFRAGRGGPEDPLETERRVHLHVYLQWLAARQLRAISKAAKKDGGGLYLDFPIGVHKDGYDPHRHPDLFARKVSVGAPPDNVFPGGQSWGFPPLVPREMRKDGYGYLRRALLHHMRSAALVRLDHAAFLHRLLWVPEGRPATEGVYVRYPADELAAVITLSSHQTGAAVVGEDLGLVPQVVRRTMARHGLRRMHVVPLELGPGRLAPPRTALACLGTHDMAPFAAWCAEDPGGRSRLAALLGAPEDPGALRDAVLAYLAASRAEVMLVSLQDLYLGRERHNVPGTPPDQNWRSRMPVTLEDVAANARVKTLAATVDRLRKEP